LEWNYETNKFDEKQHNKDHNLTVSPFPFNRIDMKKLNPDQEKRKDLLIDYFAQIVQWNTDKEEQKKIVRFLLSWIGYTLTPWREKCFHVWIGNKDSGKSTLKEIVKLLHGNKYAEADFSRWNKQKTPHDSEIIPGKLLLADDDFEVGGRLPERELKTLSQNNTITINPKHVSQFTVMNTSTPLILTNGMPRAEDVTIENRLYAVPFKSNFDRILRNITTEQFINKIKELETLEILFNISIDVAEKTIFKDGNFDQIAPDCVKDTSSMIIQSASSILLWVHEMKEQGKLEMSPDNRIKRSDLYGLYQSTFNGMKKGMHTFYESVRQRYKEVKSSGTDYFIGIGMAGEQREYKNYTEGQEKFKFEDDK
jgi:phage/plasmid-associated DNA primase